MNLLDQFKRPLCDLRISVIDTCNFRCSYCMPAENEYSFLPEKDRLSLSEIVTLARIFVGLGVRKLRLTGGEPLLRKNIVTIVDSLSKIEGVEDISLTTNGYLLGKLARPLREAGLKRITVSCDTIDPGLFHRMSGGKGDLQRILDAIDQATEAGFEMVKINTVVQKGVNDHLLIPLLEYFRERKAIVRFIEYMDVGNKNHWDLSQVVPSREILKQINAWSPVEVAEENYFGEVAERYRYLDGRGEIGFISSVTQVFCRTCTRVRLSTDGQLFTCLFASKGTDLRELLRTGASEAEIRQTIEQVWAKRTDRYSEERAANKTVAPKIEMYQIGG